MAMCMPAPVYFAVKNKNGWAYTILCTVFYLGVMVTQSRGAMLFGSVVYLGCVVVTLVGSKKKSGSGTPSSLRCCSSRC